MTDQIQNVTPPQITKESSPEQVQQWFQQSRFSKHAEKFQDLNGEDVLGLSRDGFERAGIPVLMAEALWNALHVDDDVEMGDAPGEDDKDMKIAMLTETLKIQQIELETQHTQLQQAYLHNVNQIIASNVNNTKKEQIFSETVYSEDLPIHGVLNEEDADIHEAWIALYGDDFKNEQNPKRGEVSALYKELLPDLADLYESKNPDENTDVHPIIYKILKFVKKNMCPDMNVYAECEPSRDFPVNTEKRPDFLITDDWGDTFVDVFKHMIYSIEAKNRFKKGKKSRSLRSAAFDCLRNMLYYLKQTGQLFFSEVEAFHIISDGLDWYPVKLTITRQDKIVLFTRVDILCCINIFQSKDHFEILLQLIQKFFRGDGFTFKIKAAGEKDDSYPRFNPKNDPMRTFVTKDIVQFTRRNVISKVNEENTEQYYIIKSSGENENSMLKELEISAKVQHPNILTPFLFDRDIKSNMLFSVSDIGERLGKEIKLPMQSNLLNRLVSDIFEALNYLFYEGFLYLDLHPGNVVFLDGKFKLIDLEGITYKETKWFSIGTLLFSSIGYMCGEEPTLYSSYESLLYLYEFCKSTTLPWWNENDTVRIAEMKVQLLMKTAFEILNEYSAQKVLDKVTSTDLSKLRNTRSPVQVDSFYTNVPFLSWW